MRRAARANVNNYASHNGGHPANVADDRPAQAARNNTVASNGQRLRRHDEPSNRDGGLTAQNANTGNAPHRTYNASHSNTAQCSGAREAGSRTTVGTAVTGQAAGKRSRSIRMASAHH